MKFEFYYTKLGNQFFFISNLAEWHFSCREKYNEEWIKLTGPLTNKEKEALKTFKKILRKYDFKEEKGEKFYLGIPFITPQNKKVWLAAKKWVNKKEFEKIQRIFKIFDEKFDKIWPETNKKLKKISELLKHTLNKKEELKNIMKNLSVLYNKKLIDDYLFKIYLFYHLEKNSFGGGANLNKNELTFDCSEITPNTSSEERAIRVIIHELIHDYFEKPNFKNLLENYLKKIDSKKFNKTYVFKKIKSINTIINEMIVDSIMPNGYLAEKYFHFKVKEKFKNIKEIENKKDKLLSDYRKLAVCHLYPILKKYIADKKPLDENYIRKTVKIFFKYQ